MDPKSQDTGYVSPEQRITLYPSPGAKLALALSKAQGKFTVPKKTKHVDFQPDRGQRVKYSYADLADVLDAIRAPLSENELAVTHLLVYEGEQYGLKTLLIHSSGEFIDTWYPLPDPKKENIRAQAFGSALTYARRYSISSLVGIASEEDDDGQGAPDTGGPSKNGAPAGGKHNSPPTQPPKPKNYAPGAQNSAPPPPEDDLDAVLGPQNFPEYESEPQRPPLTPLQELVSLVDERSIPPTEASDLIKRAVGREAKAKDLSNEEIKSVIFLIRSTTTAKRG